MVGVNNKLKDLLIFQGIWCSAKLYHFSTNHYSAHKSTDTFIEQFLEKMDKLFEVHQGKYGKFKSIPVSAKTVKVRIWNDKNVHSELDIVINYLYELDKKGKFIKTTDTELLNIRDELLGHVIQYKYLLQFQ